VVQQQLLQPPIHGNHAKSILQNGLRAAEAISESSASFVTNRPTQSGGNFGGLSKQRRKNAVQIAMS
jgi:hypothetical protein